MYNGSAANTIPNWNCVGHLGVICKFAVVHCVYILAVYKHWKLPHTATKFTWKSKDKEYIRKFHWELWEINNFMRFYHLKFVFLPSMWYFIWCRYKRWYISRPYQFEFDKTLQDHLQNVSVFKETSKEIQNDLYITDIIRSN